MTYSIEDRMKRLATRNRQVNSHSVTYRRNGQDQFEANATIYELRASELIEYGVSTDSRRIDFIFTRADIQDGWEPMAGDEIVDVDADLTCKVTPLGDQAVFRWTDHTRTALRVHTQAPTYSTPAE
ncbi:MAG: hypothetical protein KDA71_23660 [Planctomycetales bacterium]|nr:hypothetical protein [Planctomycetales bacterium]